MCGQLGNDELIVDMVISNNEIRGSCVFPGLKFEEGPFAGLTRTGRIEGIIDERGVASITAYTQNIESGEYSGMLGKVFKGTFREARSGMSLAFNLEEAYPEGSIPFEGYCLNMDSVLLDTIGSPFAHLNLSLLLPPDKHDFAIVREAVIKTFFGKQMIDSLADDSLLQFFGMDYFARYVNANRDLYDGGHSFNWEIINTGTIGMNRDGLLVYRSDSYGYTGGAHGMGISRFLVFDSRRMKKLGLEDIFIPGYDDELSKLLEQKYRIQYFVGPEQSMLEAGLFQDSIPPSNNFFLTENSIGFYYNPYKIAPYSMGGITISLTYEEMGSILREDFSGKGLVR